MTGFVMSFDIFVYPPRGLQPYREEEFCAMLAGVSLPGGAKSKAEGADEM